MTSFLVDQSTGGESPRGLDRGGRAGEDLSLRVMLLLGRWYPLFFLGFRIVFRSRYKVVESRFVVNVVGPALVRRAFSVEMV